MGASMQTRLLTIAGLLLGAALQAAAEPAAATTEPVWATVDDMTITQAQFEGVLARTVRARYYHGAPPENLAAQIRQEVGEQLIQRVLLVREAKRLGLAADESKITAQLTRYRERYEKSPQWPTQGEKALATLGRLLRDDDVLGQLEARTRDAAAPGADEAAKFYLEHREKFTEPRQDHVALILKMVDPSAPTEAWDKARAEAAAILDALRKGGDFAALAREKSADKTAASGGDMGYLHAGMLSTAAEEAIAKLQPGGISDAVTVLEGVAIFKLLDRREPRQREFADVKERAIALLRRERGERAWSELRARLKAAAKIDVVAAEPGDAALAGKTR
jgi:hypothetical protein